MEPWMFFAGWFVVGIPIGFMIWVGEAKKIKGWGNEEGHKALWSLVFFIIISPVLVISGLFSAAGLGLLWLLRKFTPHPKAPTNGRTE